MATSGILAKLGSAGNASQTEASALKGSSSSSSSSSSESTITASDFLTLLVTEMKNQDPTATTDPNEYINQLINVNSLEQLVNINQILTDAYGSNSSSGTSSMAKASEATNATSAVGASASAASNSSVTAANTAQTQLQAIAGNLGIPAENPSAQTVSQALTRARTAVSDVTKTN